MFGKYLSQEFREIPKINDMFWFYFYKLVNISYFYYAIIKNYQKANCALEKIFQEKYSDTC